MTHVTCRLTAKNRNQLRNPTLGNRVRATFFLHKKAIRKIYYRRLKGCIQPPLTWPRENEKNTKQTWNVMTDFILVGVRTARAMSSRRQRNSRRVNSSTHTTNNPTPARITGHYSIPIRDLNRFRFVMRIDSYCKKNRPFDSLVAMQFFLCIYCIVSAKK